MVKATLDSVIFSPSLTAELESEAKPAHDFDFSRLLPAGDTASASASGVADAGAEAGSESLSPPGQPPSFQGAGGLHEEIMALALDAAVAYDRTVAQAACQTQPQPRSWEGRHVDSLLWLLEHTLHPKVNKNRFPRRVGLLFLFLA